MDYHEQLNLLVNFHPELSTESTEHPAYVAEMEQRCVLLPVDLLAEAQAAVQLLAEMHLAASDQNWRQHYTELAEDLKEALAEDELS